VAVRAWYNLSNPVFITHSGDSSGRLFIVEQSGLIKIVMNGQVNSTPFLDLTSIVRPGGEMGLLGLAFHPQYRMNGRFFVFFTRLILPEPRDFPTTNTLVEYKVSSNPDVANPMPVRTLFELPDRFTNHNGGMIAFGPDGCLYVGTGDEDNGSDADDNAQNLNSLFGKLLRLDIDNIPVGKDYGIPPSNTVPA
jgi:glucose/arabinose dehydrogenase